MQRFGSGTQWCRTDFLLVALMAILSWLYYCINRNGGGWLDWLINLNPMWVTIIGCVVIAVFVVLGFIKLYQVTKAKVGDEDE